MHLVVAVHEVSRRIERERARSLSSVWIVDDGADGRGDANRGGPGAAALTRRAVREGAGIQRSLPPHGEIRWRPLARERPELFDVAPCHCEVLLYGRRAGRRSHV